MLARALLTLLGVALLQSAVLATHPQVTAIVPRGAKRGTEVTLTIYGQRLQTIQGLQLFQSGIEVLEVKPDQANKATVRIEPILDRFAGSVGCRDLRRRSFRPRCLRQSQRRTP